MIQAKRMFRPLTSLNEKDITDIVKLGLDNYEINQISEILNIEPSFVQDIWDYSEYHDAPDFSKYETDFEETRKWNALKFTPPLNTMKKDYRLVTAMIVGLQGTGKTTFMSHQFYDVIKPHYESRYGDSISFAPIITDDLGWFQNDFMKNHEPARIYFGGIDDATRGYDALDHTTKKHKDDIKEFWEIRRAPRKFHSELTTGIIYVFFAEHVLKGMNAKLRKNAWAVFYKNTFEDEDENDLLQYHLRKNSKAFDFLKLVTLWSTKHTLFNKFFVEKGGGEVMLGKFEEPTQLLPEFKNMEREARNDVEMARDYYIIKYLNLKRHFSGRDPVPAKQIQAILGDTRPFSTFNRTINTIPREQVLEKYGTKIYGEDQGRDDDE